MDFRNYEKETSPNIPNPNLLWIFAGFLFVFSGYWYFGTSGYWDLSKKVDYKKEVTVKEVADIVAPAAPEPPSPPPPPPAPVEEEEPNYTVVEEMPMFPGCDVKMEKQARKSCAEKAMLEFVYKNIKYPALAKDSGIEGMVVINFIVDKSGELRDFNIRRDIGGGTGQEAIRVLKLMPNWIPGKRKGEAVNISYNLPIRYKLED